MKNLVELIAVVYYAYSVIYAFIFWGIKWGILNLFIPYAPLYDLVLKLGEIK